MSELIYRVGDIFDIREGDDVVVAHVVNQIGAFGAGFAKEMATRWPDAKSHYHANFSWYKLGDVLMSPIWIPHSTTVAHMFAQDGLPSKDNPVPLKYLPLGWCLNELAEILEECPATFEVRMPRIGTGYGRGKWDVIESIIKERLTDRGITVAVYDLPC